MRVCGWCARTYQSKRHPTVPSVVGLQFSESGCTNTGIRFTAVCSPGKCAQWREQSYGPSRRVLKYISLLLKNPPFSVPLARRLSPSSLAGRSIMVHMRNASRMPSGCGNLCIKHSAPARYGAPTKYAPLVFPAKTTSGLPEAPVITAN